MQEKLKEQNQQKKESKPTFVVPIGNHIAMQVNGAWIYKSNSQAPLAVPKKKVKLRDPYQLKVMEKYEAFAKSRFQDQLANTVKAVVMFLKDA